MAAPLEPERLAELVDLAERPRVEDWSLRAALCRYGQPQPERSAAVLSVMRRIEGELAAHLKVLRVDGAELVARSAEPGAGTAAGDLDEATRLAGVLAVADELDHLADQIATWAVDRSGVRPDGPIDDTLHRLVPRLAALGVVEEGPPPAGARSRG